MIVDKQLLTKLNHFQTYRHLKFVSIDTHPAINALVVTYDVFVSIETTQEQTDVGRRSKRTQMQIKLKQLDSEANRNFLSKSSGIELDKLCNSIIQSCPLLQTSRRSLVPDIRQLITYLIKRSASQLLNSRNGISDATAKSGLPRQGSNLSIRTASALGSLRFDSAKSTLSNSSSAEKKFSITKMYKEAPSEESQSFCFNSKHLDEYLTELNNYLLQIEQYHDANSKGSFDVPNSIETCLEGLYDTGEEKSLSLTYIRQLANDKSSLLDIATNDVMICALLRVIRDDINETESALKILYCFLKLTSYQQLYDSLISQANNNELMTIVGELIENSLKQVQNKRQIDLQTYFYLRSILQLIINLLCIGNARITVTKYLLRQTKQQFCSLLVDCLDLNLNEVIHKNSTVPEIDIKIIHLYRTVTSIMQEMSIYNDFIVQLRPLRQKFAHNLVSLINSSQSTRSNNNLTKDNKQCFINNFFALEIEMMVTLGNFLYDNKIHNSLVSHNLLKVTLTSAATFLSNFKSNSIKEFNKSLILTSSLKLLYELSCNKNIRFELYKSKVVFRCLMEYLFLVNSDINSAIEDWINNRRIDYNLMDDNQYHEQEDSFKLSDRRVDHIILSLLINLSCDWHVVDILADKIFVKTLGNIQELFADTLRLTLSSITISKGRKIHLEALFKNVYLLARFIRNLSDYLQIKPFIIVNLNTKFTKNILQVGDDLLVNCDIEDKYQSVIIVQHMFIINNYFKYVSSFSKITQSNELEDLNLIIESLTKNLAAKIVFINIRHEILDDDDLNLSLLNLFGTLTRIYDVCKVIGSIENNLTCAFETIFEFRTNDNDLILCSLYVLHGLICHRKFLINLSATKPDRLIAQLMNFTFSTNTSISKLANIILDDVCFGTNEQQNTDAQIYRFCAYNKKWLDIIQTSSEDLMSSLSDYQRKDDLQSCDYTDLNLVYDTEVYSKSQAKNSVSRKEGKEYIEDISTENDIYYSDSERDTDESYPIPDLEVIDSNSMINHLIDKNQFSRHLDESY